jgi:hypothetical protein
MSGPRTKTELTRRFYGGIGRISYVFGLQPVGCGLLLALGSLQTINTLLPENIGFLKHVDVNDRVLAFTVLPVSRDRCYLRTCVSVTGALPRQSQECVGHFESGLTWGRFWRGRSVRGVLATSEVAHRSCCSLDAGKSW